MRSRLFGRAEYEALLAKSSLDELIAALSKTLYRDQVELALIQADKQRCVPEAVRLNFTGTLRQMHHFYEGEPQLLLDLLLRRWDRHNLLTILRGQRNAVAPDTVLAALIPVGQLDEVALRELARQPGLRAAIDLLTTWQLPYARPLRAVGARQGATPDLDQLELALNRYHYRALLEASAGGDENRGMVREHLRTEIDLLNLRATLRLARLPGAVALVKQRYSAPDARPLLVESGGHLPVQRLVDFIAGAAGPEAVVRGLSDTRYGTPLQLGWERYQAPGGHFAMIERELERWQAHTGAAMFARNPLSIAIPLGFLACKEVEAANLRLIAQAVRLDLDREEIKADLIFG
jgi:V/A-type H+-transporting ATPase subunit C